jgi:hypothetical protein
VRKLRQLSDEDCFITTVACITELDRSELPDVIPTTIPDDIEGVWTEWGDEYGYAFDIHESDPGGICVALIHIAGEWAETQVKRYGVDFATHAVVWHKGMYWDPMRGVTDWRGNIHRFVKIERV